jgi:hypothetical protein
MGALFAPLQGRFARVRRPSPSEGGRGGGGTECDPLPALPQMRTFVGGLGLYDLDLFFRQAVEVVDELINGAVGGFDVALEELLLLPGARGALVQLERRPDGREWAPFPLRCKDAARGSGDPRPASEGNAQHTLRREYICGRGLRTPHPASLRFAPTCYAISQIREAS